MTTPSSGAGLQRARALLQAGRAGEACTVLSDAVASAPDDPELLCELANAVRERGGPGDAQAALDLVNQTLALDPQAERPHRIAAVILGSAGLRYDAVIAASEAVRRAPRSPLARHALANALVNGNWLVEAATIAEDLVAERPDSALDLRTLAHIRIRQARPDLADPVIRRAVALEPEDPEGVRLAGLTAIQQGDRAAGAARLVSAQRLNLGSDRAGRALRATTGTLLSLPVAVRFLLHALLLAAVAVPSTVAGRAVGAAIVVAVGGGVELISRRRLNADPQFREARRLARTTHRAGWKGLPRVTKFTVVVVVTAVTTAVVGGTALRAAAGYFAALQLFLALTAEVTTARASTKHHPPPTRNRSSVGQPPLERPMPVGGYRIGSRLSIRRIGGLPGNR